VIGQDRASAGAVGLRVFSSERMRGSVENWDTETSGRKKDEGRSCKEPAGRRWPGASVISERRRGVEMGWTLLMSTDLAYVKDVEAAL
jgi:hypothetical protein